MSLGSGRRQWHVGCADRSRTVYGRLGQSVAPGRRGRPGWTHRCRRAVQARPGAKSSSDVGENMTHGGAMSEAIVGRRHYVLLSITSAVTFLLIVMGGVVCMTGSGLGCPDWPMCYGGIIPPVDMGAIIETTHRFLAALTSPLIVAAAVMGWRRHRSIWWLSRPPVIAVALVLAVVVFGAFAVLTGLPPLVAAVDVGCALTVLALVLTTSVVAC